MKLLIKGGRLIDPVPGVDTICDIGIEDGKIACISGHIPDQDYDEVIDASHMVVSPGFIDLHVHLREPGQEAKEDIETGCRAAVHGGFTSIACMPNTTPVNDNLEVTGHILKRAQAVGLVNVFPVAAATKFLQSQVRVPMAELVAAGVRGFSDDGRCVMNLDLLRHILIETKRLGVPFIEHAEDHHLSPDGQVSPGAALLCHLAPIPPGSEESIIERDIRFQKETDSFLHLTHLSTRGSVRLILEARQRGTRVTCDVTPHHLLLDESELASCHTLYKMKPPLRTVQDRLALVEALVNGTIDCVATDHAPHTTEEKSRDFVQAPFGVIGMETAFPVIYDRLVRPGIMSLTRLIQVFSSQPARVLHLDCEGKGAVQPGAPADLTILDLEQPFKIHADDFYSKAENCPFLGWEGFGSIAYTIVNGEIMYNQYTGISG